MTKKGTAITVGEMRQRLAAFDDGDILDFCGLDFYRLKQRGPNLVQVEFNQPVYLDGADRVVVDNLD